MSARLRVEKVTDDLICLINPIAPAPQSAFAWLAGGGSKWFLLNAGWLHGDVVAPEDALGRLVEAIKVSTHFHHDWVKQWAFLRENIWISRKQAEAQNCNDQGLGCRPALEPGGAFCAPEPWLTFEPVHPFPVSGVYEDDEADLGEAHSSMASIAVEGHSQTDVALLHRPSRTLFLGDLFFVGPKLFYFFPQGSIAGALRSLTKLLERNDWEHTAQIRGDSFRCPRVFLEEFHEALGKIATGQVAGTEEKLDWWSLPVVTYPFKYTHGGVESSVAERLVGRRATP